MISLITFIFYNKSSFEKCIRLGLFNQLVRLVANLKQLEYVIVNNSQKKPVDSRKKYRAIETSIHAFNICYDIVRETKAFNKLNCINGEEFESII